MTFVITQGCCNDGSCISVCPVQCIRPRPGDPDFTTVEQLYIDPATCIDCAACMDECPVEAISADYDLPEHLSEYLQINADYFGGVPVKTEEPEPTARRRLPESRPRLRVAVVGSGPSACYAVGSLTDIRGVEVSVFERLPTPFGLARAGVAPDHANTKLIGETFRAILSRRSVTCFFNVEVGRDITVDELLEHHHAVIWAAGAADDRRLSIPGEDLPGSWSARELVAWYNGHPEHANADVDLSGERAVVIGNGNVALDVARVLTRAAADYERTDIADHALEALRSSGVREVVVAARRGPAQISGTSPELLALEQLDGVDLLARPDEVGHQPDHRDDPVGSRKKALIERAATRVANDTNRRIILRFFLTPISINGTDCVESVTFERTALVENDGAVGVESTGQTETIEASLVLRAAGYRGHASPGLPFDEASGTIPHEAGRVHKRPGVYAAGWIKRGPSGVIGTNKYDSDETVASLLDDFAAGRLVEPAGDADRLESLVKERRPAMIDNAGWLRINAVEKKRGTPDKRPRSKLVTVEELLAASAHKS